mmetsp:Transcript_3911/g.15143  ORF Transcript_3911/g.15143 Transcript_3911/m.15143 type:complete len:409 (-) Transcript_3911:48-1274(-)|eukprot:scaffold7041_cov311-Pinguiococcus_pyrenoidosus.AAC.5
MRALVILGLSGGLAHALVTAPHVRAPRSALWSRRSGTDASLDNFPQQQYVADDSGALVSDPLRARRAKHSVKSFARFMEIEAFMAPKVDALRPTLQALANACKSISELVRNSAGYDLDGMFEESRGQAMVNVQGEDQKKLDVVTNRILKATICAGGSVACVASEEEDVPQLCRHVLENAAFSGDFAVVFDPLDGSANIDSGLSAGTIFGIYRRPEGAADEDWEQALFQRGSELLAAGYCLYGSSTTLVLSTGRGVNAFSFDAERGEFVLQHENIRVPKHGNIYSFNEGNYYEWEPAMMKYVDDLKRGTGPLQRRYTARYQGALAADVHTILLRGGIFGYPGTVNKPKGKLRILYEAIPISFLIEQAGGVGSDGQGRILNRAPKEVHERIPFFVGSPDEVELLEQYLRG